MTSWETVPRAGDETAGVLRILKTIGSNLSLRQVLYQLVDATLEITGAERSLIFLVEGDALVPGALASRHPNVELFQRFRSLRPISLDDDPVRREAVDAGQLIVIENTSNSPLVPADWAAAFGDRSVAVVPLAGTDEWFGLLVVDHPAPYSYPDEELNSVRTIAQSARIAIRGAALHERLVRRAELLREVGVGLARIGSDVDLREVLRSITESTSTLLGGRACSITFGDETVTSAAQRENGDRTSIPLRTASVLHGYLTIRGNPPINADEFEVLETFAQQAALAIDRVRLNAELRERDWRAEAATRLADVLVEPGELRRVLARLNDEVCRKAGIECGAVAFRRRRVAELLGTRTLDPGELTLATRMAVERIPAVQQVDPDGLHAAPIVISGRVAGVLFVRPTSGRGPLSRPQLELVAMLAARVGEVAQKARLQAALRDAETRLTLAAAHRRVADRIGATLGPTVEALWRQLSTATARHRGSPEVLHDLSLIRSLAARTLMEVHASTESVAVLGVRRDGLYRSLRTLLDSFELVSGASTTLRTNGDPPELPVDIEENLFSVAFDALWGIERSGRATTVVLTLSYGDGVTLKLRDDGRGLAQRGSADAGPGVHFGVQSIRDRVAELGGRLTIEGAEPRGVVLEVHLPREALVADPGPRAPDRPENRLRRARVKEE